MRKKITATVIIVICIIMAGETITYTRIRVAHCPLVVVVVEYAHTDTQMASFERLYLPTYIYISIIYIFYFFLSIYSVVVVAAYYCSLTNCLPKSMRSFISFVCRYIIFFTLQTGFLTKPRFPSYWPHLAVTLLSYRYSWTLQIYSKYACARERIIVRIILHRADERVY